jgi:hypothetical protein
MADKGLTREVEMGAPRIIGETLGMAGPAIATAKAPQIAAGMNQMVDNAMAPAAMNKQTGAIVWHGSPHKFDKFDSSKIGTGEGAQAYGHGLYLAESPDVAKGYQQGLTNGALIKDADVSDDAFYSAQMLMKNYMNNMDEVLKAKPTYAPAIEAQKLIKSGKIRPEGSLYKVDLPDDQIAKMLDWDKPLSQQPQGAREALAKLDPDMYHPSGGDYDPTELGQMIYQRLAQKGQDAAAISMRQQGIPGIRYLDGGSRSDGAGTSNFVVFPGNEGVLKIMERNGQPLGLMGGVK